MKKLSLNDFKSNRVSNLKNLVGGQHTTSDGNADYIGVGNIMVVEGDDNIYQCNDDQTVCTEI